MRIIDLTPRIQTNSENPTRIPFILEMLLTKEWAQGEAGK